jgi:hypothetical protein
MLRGKVRVKRDPSEVGAARRSYFTRVDTERRNQLRRDKKRGVRIIPKIYKRPRRERLYPGELRDKGIIYSSNKGGAVGALAREGSLGPGVRAIPKSERASLQKGINSFVNIHEANEIRRSRAHAQLAKKYNLENLTSSGQVFSGRQQVSAHNDMMVPLLDHNIAVTATGPGSVKLWRLIQNLRVGPEADFYSYIVRHVLGDPNWKFGVSPKLNRHARKKIERALLTGKGLP